MQEYVMSTCIVIGRLLSVLGVLDLEFSIIASNSTNGIVFNTDTKKNVQVSQSFYIIRSTGMLTYKNLYIISYIKHFKMDNSFKNFKILIILSQSGISFKNRGAICSSKYVVSGSSNNRFSEDLSSPQLSNFVLDFL